MTKTDTGLVTVVDRYRKKSFEVEAIQYTGENRDRAEKAEADNAAKVEQERLRFEGDLDKWMKIIGAGITGYQPEAYALMDLACYELVKLRSDISAIAGHVDCEADSDSILHIIRDLEADNAALTARIKELENILRDHRASINHDPRNRFPPPAQRALPRGWHDRPHSHRPGLCEGSTEGGSFLGHWPLPHRVSQRHAA